MGRGRLGEYRVKRGEIRWYTFRLPDKRRPLLILTRNEIIDRLNEIIVVPVTRTIRGVTTEVVLTEDDGMPVVCALNLTTSHWRSAIASAVFFAVCRKRDGRKCSAHS